VGAAMAKAFCVLAQKRPRYTKKVTPLCASAFGIFTSESTKKQEKKKGIEIGWQLTHSHDQKDKKTKIFLAVLKSPFDCGST
jgi:hypothetical protein